MRSYKSEREEEALKPLSLFIFAGNATSIEIVNINGKRHEGPASDHELRVQENGAVKLMGATANSTHLYQQSRNTWLINNFSPQEQFGGMK
jgi:hypothetical protein